jgi:DnaK suppressor protein
MTEKNLIPYRDLLLEKRAELARVGGSKSVGARLEAVRLPDSVDQSAHSSEESIQVHLRQTDSKLLKAIDAALNRIERGTFGVCEVCAQPIPAPRLKAVPWARQCRDCKEQQDAGEPRQASSPRGADQLAE